MRSMARKPHSIVKQTFTVLRTKRVMWPNQTKKATSQPHNQRLESIILNWTKLGNSHKPFTIKKPKKLRDF